MRPSRISIEVGAENAPGHDSKTCTFASTSGAPQVGGTPREGVALISTIAVTTHAAETMAISWDSGDLLGSKIAAASQLEGDALHHAGSKEDHEQDEARSIAPRSCH